MNTQFKGTALITGASSGIGATYANRLVTKNGATHSTELK